MSPLSAPRGLLPAFFPCRPHDIHFLRVHPPGLLGRFNVVGPFSDEVTMDRCGESLKIFRCFFRRMNSRFVLFANHWN